MITSLGKSPVTYLSGGRYSGSRQPSLVPWVWAVWIFFLLLTIFFFVFHFFCVRVCGVSSSVCLCVSVVLSLFSGQCSAGVQLWASSCYLEHWWRNSRGRCFHDRREDVWHLCQGVNTRSHRMARITTSLLPLPLKPFSHFFIICSPGLSGHAARYLACLTLSHPHAVISWRMENLHSKDQTT